MRGFREHISPSGTSLPTTSDDSVSGQEHAVEMADIGMALRTAEDHVRPSGIGIQRAGSSFLAREVFVLMLLHNGGSCNACTLKRCITFLCITKQIMLLNVAITLCAQN
jgi:hypothetical protein